MKLNRTAVAVALAMAGGSALGQQAAAPVTAETSVQIYGHLDVSIDDITKGIAGKSSTVAPVAAIPATGKLGDQSDISSHLAYLGVRGSQTRGPSGLRWGFQA